MAFYAHMGATYTGTGAAALTTFNTILDDIVADVAAAVGAGKANGWSVYDDQRNLQAGPTTMVVGYVFCKGLANQGTGGISLTQNSTAITGSTTAFNREFAQGSFTIQLASNNGAAWSPGYVSAVASATGATFSTNWTAATATTQRFAMSRVTAASGGATYGYIVLQCLSQNSLNPFYVRIMRPPSFGDLVRIDVFESWDPVAHVGTNPGPQEIIRGYPTQQTQTTQMSYMLWLLPDTFGFYGGQVPANNVPGDFFYAGNLNPFRGVANDYFCLVQACSYQGLSGFGTWSRSVFSTASMTSHGGSVNRLIGGYQSLWSPTVANYLNSVCFAPRGADYLIQASAATADDRGLMQMVGVDVYESVQAAAETDYLMMRGTARYLKYPVMSPSGQFLNTYPADDGNTYIMVRAGYTVGAAGFTDPTVDTGWSGAYLSGFAMPGNPLVAGGQYAGDVGYLSTTTANLCRRFFLLPVNL